MRRDRRQPVLQVAVEFRAHRVGRVAGIDEAGEAAEPAEDLLDPLVFGDRRGEPGAAIRRLRDRLELALVALLERLAHRRAAVEVALHLRRVHRRVEIGEVPDRKRSEVVGRLFGSMRALRHELSPLCSLLFHKQAAAGDAESAALRRS